MDKLKRPLSILVLVFATLLAACTSGPATATPTRSTGAAPAYKADDQVKCEYLSVGDVKVTGTMRYDTCVDTLKGKALSLADGSQPGVTPTAGAAPTYTPYPVQATYTPYPTVPPPATATSAPAAPVATATTIQARPPTQAAAPTNTAPTQASQPGFTYTPGGRNYAYPTEGAVQDMGDGWTRIRQAANGQYLPWTFLVRISADKPLDQVAQWDSATKLLLAGQDQPITVKVEIKRDPNAAGECSCDPYQQAHGDQTGLGLGWFITGNGASVVVNGAPAVDLNGLGVKQMSFPKDWNGTWTLTITIRPNGQVTLNQGERRTNVDNWPLP